MPEPRSYNAEGTTWRSRPIMLPLKYLSAYPQTLQDKVRKLIADHQLGKYLDDRYPHRHAVQSDRALYQYATDLKQEFLRVAPAIDKVMYDAKLDVLRHALGLHTAISRVQGASSKRRRRFGSRRYSRRRPRNSCA